MQGRTPTAINEMDDRSSAKVSVSQSKSVSVHLNIFLLNTYYIESTCVGRSEKSNKMSGNKFSCKMHECKVFRLCFSIS